MRSGGPGVNNIWKFFQDRKIKNNTNALSVATLSLCLLDLPRPETLGGEFSFIERTTAKLSASLGEIYRWTLTVSFSR